MEKRHDFGVIRELLQRPPSERVFDTLCLCLGNAPPEEEVLEYVREHILAWPDEILRDAPLAWIWREIELPGSCPQLQLCNSLIADPNWERIHDAAIVDGVTLDRRRIDTSTVWSLNDRTRLALSRQELDETDQDDIPF